MDNTEAISVRGTVFFDYDGTLHDSMRLYGPAFRMVYAWLVEGGYANPREFSEEEISQWLGWTVEDMWTTFMPGLPEEVWRKASALVGSEMNRLMEEGKGSLFAGVPEMMKELQDAGFDLVFLSNCGFTYRDNHIREFGLGPFLNAAYCAEEFDFISKWKIFQQVKKSHAAPFVMVGDRFHDIEVAVKANIPSIGCSYGFGAEEELDDATVLVKSPGEISAAVVRLLA